MFAKIVVGVAGIILGAIALDESDKPGPQGLQGPGGPSGPEGAEGPAGLEGPAGPSNEETENQHCKARTEAYEGLKEFTASNPGPSLFKWNGRMNKRRARCGFLQVPISYNPTHLKTSYPFAARAKDGYPTPTQARPCYRQAHSLATCIQDRCTFA